MMRPLMDMFKLMSYDWNGITPQSTEWTVWRSIGQKYQPWMEFMEIRCFYFVISKCWILSKAGCKEPTTNTEPLSTNPSAIRVYDLCLPSLTVWITLIWYSPSDSDLDFLLLVVKLGMNNLCPKWPRNHFWVSGSLVKMCPVMFTAFHICLPMPSCAKTNLYILWKGWKWVGESFSIRLKFCQKLSVCSPAGRKHQGNSSQSLQDHIGLFPFRVWLLRWVSLLI